VTIRIGDTAAETHAFNRARNAVGSSGDASWDHDLLVEEVGRHGQGVTAHLSPDGARHLRSTLGAALRSLGEDPGA
jgi:hypothetical protein